MINWAWKILFWRSSDQEIYNQKFLKKINKVNLYSQRNIDILEAMMNLHKICYRNFAKKSLEKSNKIKKLLDRSLIQHIANLWKKIGRWVTNNKIYNKNLIREEISQSRNMAGTFLILLMCCFLFYVSKVVELRQFSRGDPDWAEGDR